MRVSLLEQNPGDATVSSLSRSLKVIGIDTDESGTCDLLLTFLSNHGPILYHFQDSARYWPKIANFSERTSYFVLPLTEFSLE